MIESLLMLVIYILIIGVVLYLLDFLLGMLPLPPPFAQIIRVVIIVIGVIIIIYLLLGLLHTPLRLP